MALETAMAEPGNSSRFVTRTAWLFIIVSILWTIIAVAQYVAYLHTLATLESLHAAAAGATRTATHLVAIARVAIGLALFASALGLLKRRRWARHALVALASIGIATNAYRLVAALSSTSSVPLPEDAPAGEVWIVRIGDFLGYTYPLVVCLLLGWIVVKLMSRSVSEELRRR